MFGVKLFEKVVISAAARTSAVHVVHDGEKPERFLFDKQDAILVVSELGFVCGVVSDRGSWGVRKDIEIKKRWERRANVCNE